MANEGGPLAWLRDPFGNRTEKPRKLWVAKRGQRKRDTVLNIARGARATNVKRKYILPVIFSFQRSVWSSVWPIVALNTAISCGIHVLNNQGVYDLSISDAGHGVAGTLVAFFIVTRLNMSYARMMRGRSAFSSALLAMREFCGNAIALTKRRQEEEVKLWRGDLVEGAAVICDELCTALDARTKRTERKALHELVDGLRSRLADERCLAKPLLTDNDRAFLMGNIADFVSASADLGKMMTALMPWQMLHMSRTLTFSWVFTLPFALETHLGRLSPIAIFFVTFSFVGIEMMSIEMDDPFGDDIDDIDARGMLLSMLCEVDNLYELCDGPSQALRSLMVQIELPVQPLEKPSTNSLRRTLQKSLRRPSNKTAEAP